MTANLDSLYQDVLSSLSNNDLLLPSMPELTMKVRAALKDDNTSCDSLTEIISKDPTLTAYLVQAGSSPIYRRAVPPKTLSEVIGLLGFASVNSLVMLHSTRSMVELKNATAKHLFSQTWERLVVKTSLASFIASQVKYRPVDHVQMAMLLTEVGSLAVLSTMLGTAETPDTETYFKMCRQYSKNIGCTILEKWEVDESIIHMLHHCGNWEYTEGDRIELIDIANLALYHTVLMTVETPSLPDLSSIAAYKKLPSTTKACGKENWLDLVTDNDEEIQKIISSFR